MYALSTIVTGILALNLVSATPYNSSQHYSVVSVADCLAKADVPSHWPASPDYDDLARPFNLRLPYKPYVIVLPRNEQNVRDSVICAARGSLKVQAKCGGHSYASYSSGGRDGSMVVDLQYMHDITLDTDTNIIKAGGGVRLGNLAKAAWDQGKRALSHGTCPPVGLGGHSTHGGYGQTSRHWGLALDHIVAADVVLADGQLVHASFTENTEIFWAIRGAADSFGIVTNFYLRTHEAPANITHFSFEWGRSLWSKRDFRNAFLHFQDFAKNGSVVDSRISFSIYIDEYVYNLSGTFFGSVEEFNSNIRPELLRGVGRSKATVQSLEWIPYLTLLSGADTVVVPPHGYDEHDTFFAKSITVPEDKGLSVAAIDSFYDYVKTTAPTDYFIIINQFGGPGSQINTKDINFAAYSDRNALWVFQNYGYGSRITDPGSLEWINGINDAIISAQPDTDFGAYLAYVDPSYDAQTAHKVYYGDELYAKLVDLKVKYDPNQVYWNPQAIGITL